MTVTQVVLLCIVFGGIGVVLGALMYRGTDIWHMQRQLMRKSGQQTPAYAMLTKGTILYLGLIAEELSETTAEALSVSGDLRDAAKLGPQARAVRHVHQALFEAVPLLHNVSTSLRHAASLLPDDYAAPLSINGAEGLADGFTDLAVTVAGGAIATGIPGGPCYEEVQNSNLSKADPVTGLINRDATGKWIKGPMYRKPQLRHVLEDAACTAHPDFHNHH